MFVWIYVTKLMHLLQSLFLYNKRCSLNNRTIAMLPWPTVLIQKLSRLSNRNIYIGQSSGLVIFIRSFICHLCQSAAIATARHATIFNWTAIYVVMFSYCSSGSTHEQNNVPTKQCVQGNDWKQVRLVDLIVACNVITECIEINRFNLLFSFRWLFYIALK